MRRKDREVKDPAVIDEIIREGEYMTLALCDGNKPYAVPLSYGYDGECFYFHGALEGRKTDLIRKNPQVCLNISTGMLLKGGKQACDYTSAFRSVTAEGNAEILTSDEDKMKGLNEIMRQATGRGDWSYPHPMLSHVLVVRIRITSISGKIHE